MSARKLMCLVVAFVVITLSGCMGQQRQMVLDELNGDRTENNLRALPLQADANAKAQAWADKLAKENKLYHSNLPDGIKVKWCSIGENVGYGGSVEAIEDAYMASPGHKANIVNTKWNGVGVGHAKTADGKRIFTVQVFIKTC